VRVASKKNGPISPLEDRMRHTHTPGRVTVHSSVTHGFSVTQYTAVLTESDNVFKSGFIRPNNEIRKRFSYIMHV
jgi:hypothetical protein